MQPASNSEVASGGPSSRFLRPGLTAAAMLAGAALAILGLGNHVFTEDEATTALFARNLAKFGTLTAWDGTNLIGYAFGEELGENLRNVKIPRQQFYIAAAGMRIFGETARGARMAFVLIGILAIGLTGWWARRHFGERFPYYLPAFLLALSPAFLLSIRNCRYYAAGIFWAVLVLAVWTAAAPRRDDGEAGLRSAEPKSHGRAAFLWAAAIIAVAGLFLSNDLLAAATMAVLPVFFLDARFRCRSQVALLAVLYTVALPFAIWALFRLNVWQELVTRREAAAVPLWKSFSILFWRHLRDMGGAEYFAWPMLIPLVLPWCVPRLRPQQSLAKQGLILAAVFFAFIAFICLVSPTRTDLTVFADVRFTLPLIVMGTLISGASLAILWKTHWAIAIAAGFALVLTNVLHLAPRAAQPRFTATGRATIRSTLFDYVYENLHPYPSVHANLTEWLKRVPPGTKVRIIPFNVAYAPMFYHPELKYCAQLTASKPIRPELAGELPPYVFKEHAEPEILIIHPSAAGPDGLQETMTRQSSDAKGGFLHYRLVATIPTRWPNGTGPDIPFHYFYKPPAGEEFAVYQLEE